jgi:peptidoglycan/xylan/chitin deacetylase (PgdA/CDA1 family)
VLIIAGVACFFWLYRREISTENIQTSVAVLMYHKVLPDYTDDLTVSVPQLEEHLQFLQRNGYQILPLSSLLESISAKTGLPCKSVFITFDDGYLNNLVYAYPVLEKYGARATIFLPTRYIGQKSSWDKEADDLMNISQLKSLNPALISFGLHSHTHQNYKKLGIAEITEDLQQNIAYFKANGLSFVPAFAYPYGGRPKDKILLRQMKTKMQSMGIALAFRIGNRLNKAFSDVYELQRLDIKGTDTFEVFQKKLKGRGKVL